MRKGQKHKKESNEKNRISHTGMSMTEETKIKMRKSAKGFQRRHKLESRKKMSETKKRLFREGKIKPWNYIDGRSKLITTARYGDDWDKIRYLVYCRDKFTCQECRIQGIIMDIHHKIPFMISFDNSLNNLITLCRSCHRKIEAQIMREFKKQEVIIQ